MQEHDDDQPVISKTKLKAEADAKQTLGKTLIDLPLDKINQLDLPEALLEAVLEAKRIKSNSALRRQVQYIGRLMRDVNPEPIQEQLDRWNGKNQLENARFHAMERWRDRLISEGGRPNAEALQQFVAKYPSADIQQLRNLSRNANKEHTNNKPPKSSRELFKLIREITESTT